MRIGVSVDQTTHQAAPVCLRSAPRPDRGGVAEQESKREQRVEARRRRRALAATQRRDASRAVAARLCALDEVRRAGTVALYEALPDELDLGPARAMLARRDVRVLLPRVEEGEIVLVAPGDERPVPGYRGVSEPLGPAEPFDDVDAVVVPGVAFDRAGNRLGRGGGHYDRLLAALPPSTVRIGACFACQLFDEVLHDEHDEPVDIVVTERGVVRIRERPARRPRDGCRGRTDRA